MAIPLTRIRSPDKELGQVNDSSRIHPALAIGGAVDSETRGIRTAVAAKKKPAGGPTGLK
jgi:hypothetical protein